MSNIDPGSVDLRPTHSVDITPILDAVAHQGEAEKDG